MEDMERMGAGNGGERAGGKKKRQKKDGNKPSHAVIFTCDF